MSCLGAHGVVDTELARSLRSAIGLRDVLVHDYVDAGDAIVIDRLRDLSDLRAFVVAIARMLESE